MKILRIPLSHVRFLYSVIGNFQTGQIYAEAKIHHKGKFAPWGNKHTIWYIKSMLTMYQMLSYILHNICEI